MKFLSFAFMRLIVVVVTSVHCFVALAADDKGMTVAGAQQDPALKPVMGDAWTIYLNGTIDSGASKRLETFLIVNHVPRQSWIILNSPGGSLFGGMELGKTIRQYELRTDVGQQEGEIPQPLKYSTGGCYSACTLAYVGGSFRFLRSGSHFGIHRFAFSVPEKSEADLAQMASASIVAYLRSMDIDPDLFSLSTTAPPSEIYEPPPDVLTQLNVVNSGFTKPKWTMESNNGIIYLKGERDSIYGINKFILGCVAPSRMDLYVIFDRQGHQDELMSFQAHSLVIDDHNIPVSPVAKKVVNGWFNVEYTLSAQQLDRIRHATTVGVIVQSIYGASLFLGFDRLPFGDGQNQLDGLMNSCRVGQSKDQISVPGPGLTGPQSAPIPQYASEADIALAKRVARNFDMRYKKAGMTGIKSSVTACYDQARKSSSYSAIEYCYLLDQVASVVDIQVVAKSLGSSQFDAFWKPESALARTNAIISSVPIVPEASPGSIEYWSSLKPIIIGELSKLN